MSYIFKLSILRARDLFLVRTYTFYMYVGKVLYKYLQHIIYVTAISLSHFLLPSIAYVEIYWNNQIVINW